MVKNIKVTLPDPIFEALRDHCLKENLGMSAVLSDNFGIVILGNSELSVNEIAILCAHSLLEGVLSGTWVQSNEECKAEETLLNKKPN